MVLRGRYLLLWSGFLSKPTKILPHVRPLAPLTLASRTAHTRVHRLELKLIPLPFDWFPPSLMPASHRRLRLHFVNQAPEKGREWP